MLSMKQLLCLTTLSLTSLCVTGCATVKSGNYCDVASPIYFDSEQQVRETPPSIQRQVRDHNRKWSELCK